MPVRRRCQALHFFHACAWRIKAGGDTGEYVIRYADGTERAVPLVSGKNIGNLWASDNPPEPLPSETTVPWCGRSLLSKENGTEMVLFHYRWQNPRPGETIASVTFRSRLTPCAPSSSPSRRSSPLECGL